MSSISEEAVEAALSAEPHAVGSHTAGPDAAGFDAAGPDAAELQAAELHATESDSDLELADQLGNQVVRIVRLIHKLKSQTQRPGPAEIERSAYAILFSLIYDGPQRASHLSEALHSDISTISRQSSTLVQHGLIERRADPEDGRACILAPTVEGLRVFEESRKRRSEWFAIVLNDWPDSDKKQLIELITRLNSGIEDHLSSIVPESQRHGPNTQHQIRGNVE